MNNIILKLKNKIQMKKSESKIKCKSCRQYISSDKMFLHEGFCNKNNIFCEHCEQVFLREEYDSHILEISKNLSNKNKQTVIKRLTTDFNGFRNNINNDNIIVKPIKKNSMRIPIIEEYSIRKPIYIGPYSNINDDFHLTLQDLDLIRKSIYKSQRYNLIFNTEYNYGVRKNIIRNNQINYYSGIRMKKINRANILCNNNIFNEKNSILISDKKNENKNNLSINIRDNNFVKNKIDSITLGNDFNLQDINNKERSKSIDIYSCDVDSKNSQNISSKNKSNIIINNHIITYNSNNNINKINNIINEIESNKIESIFVNKPKKDNIILEKYKSCTNINNKKYKGDMNKNNCNEGIIKKEPLDNISKKKYMNNTYNMREKKPENKIIKNKYSLVNKEKNNFSLTINRQLSNISDNKSSLSNKLKTKKIGLRTNKTPINSLNKAQKNKKLNHKLEKRNKKEDIDTSSPDEKNIILIRNIKLKSRNNYKENFPLKNVLLQKGKSQDNILRKKIKKKKIVIINNHSSIKDKNNYPEDTDKILKSIPHPKNSNKIKNIIKI